VETEPLPPPPASAPKDEVDDAVDALLGIWLEKIRI
jgi:hypothetical protein